MCYKVTGPNSSNTKPLSSNKVALCVIFVHDGLTDPLLLTDTGQTGVATSTVYDKHLLHFSLPSIRELIPSGIRFCFNPNMELKLHLISKLICFCNMYNAMYMFRQKTKLDPVSKCTIENLIIAIVKGI